MSIFKQDVQQMTTDIPTASCQQYFHYKLFEKHRSAYNCFATIIPATNRMLLILSSTPQNQDNKTKA
ncbi:MAG: hypothetical protein ACLFM1_04315 [Bacteroidales bacterium]